MRALWELARRQLGLLTKAQAIQLVTIDEFRTLVERGHVHRYRRGVWVVAGAPRSYEQAVLAALLAAGWPAWASHRTAAKLHGLLVPPPDAIDVLTLPNRRLRMEGVAQHRNRQVPEDQFERRGAIDLTSVARTLVDCAPWLPGPRLGRAVDDARRKGLVTPAELEAAQAFVDRGRRTGRHLVLPLRPVVADRREAGGSERELDVLRILGRAGLPLPVQQHRVIVAGRIRYLDYAYPEQRVFIEWDGFAEHGLIRSTFDDDRDRDAELALDGWLGIHVTSNTREHDLVSRVERALGRVVDTSGAHRPATVHNSGTNVRA